MIGSPLRQLLWKEYRAIRSFWLALILVALGLQGLVFLTTSDSNWQLVFIYNVALAAPAFFALGCAGTAFALEKEEGTFDWLQASPVNERQVLASKLVLATLATLAMYLVLWPLALWINGGNLPAETTLHGMLGLWLLAAVEALAWATLFSLLLARPLVAIVAALVVCSTLTHLLAWSMSGATSYELHFAPYLKAVPLRLIALVPLLIADVYLGLRWLGPRESRRLPAASVGFASQPASPAGRDGTAPAIALAHRSDRGMLLGHLFWQHAKQSLGLTLLLSLLQIATAILVRFSGVDLDNTLMLLPLIGFAAIVGAVAFLPDQERRHYRFFIEHNVPPRYVWLTRLVPWLVAATISALAVVLLWIGAELLSKLITAGLTVFQAIGMGRRVEFNDYYQLPPLFLGIASAILAFAAGQWISMFVRSGLISGFLSLLLAVVLTGWVFVISGMRLSWLVFIAPIPLVLLWATWLRAPDWIAENVTWRARRRAAAAVLVPACMLLTAVPIIRVYQIPKVDPGFSPEAFIAEITPDGLATGKIYRRASDMTTFGGLAARPLDSFKPLLSDSKSASLGENAEPLDLILQAAARPECFLASPATLNGWPLVNNRRLITLILGSGRQLETDGKLEQALDRYFLAFSVYRQLTNHAPNTEHIFPDTTLLPVFSEFVGWSAHAAQTDALIRSAIQRLERIDIGVLNLEDGLKSNYILDTRTLAGSNEALAILYRDPALAARLTLVARLMPWERAREQRKLNQVSQAQLSRLHTVREAMERGENASNQADPFDRGPYTIAADPLRLATNLSHWFNQAVANQIVFECQRRATILTLACRAYQRSRGKLPEALADLTLETAEGPAYLENLPADPYTGRDFVYFPDGIPVPNAPREVLEHGSPRFAQNFTTPVQVGIPCLWSPGVMLVAGVWNPSTVDDPSQLEVVFYNYRHDLWFYGNGQPDYGRRLSDYRAWMIGDWFPIPAAN